MAEGKVTASLRLLVIGGSAGSLEPLLRILPALDATMHAAIILVLHRKPSKEDILVSLLTSRTNWQVKEAEEKEKILPQHLYIVPGDYHLLIENDHTLSLDVSEKINFSRPSIDVTFDAAARTFKDKLVALLLSGANADGAAGMQKVKAFGGVTMVQDPADAEVDFMPRQAIETGEIELVLPTDKIASHINRIMAE